jgi:hypothetical protein
MKHATTLVFFNLCRASSGVSGAKDVISRLFAFLLQALASLSTSIAVASGSDLFDFEDSSVRLMALSHILLDYIDAPEANLLTLQLTSLYEVLPKVGLARSFSLNLCYVLSDAVSSR